MFENRPLSFSFFILLLHPDVCFEFSAAASITKKQLAREWYWRRHFAFNAALPGVSEHPAEGQDKEGDSLGHPSDERPRPCMHELLGSSVELQGLPRASASQNRSRLAHQRPPSDGSDAPVQVQRSVWCGYSPGSRVREGDPD